MQKFLNNFETTFVASVKDSPGTADPATELDYGILRLSDGAAAFLTNPDPGDFYVLTAYKRDGTMEVNQEIMKVTAVDNTQPGECRITVERGQEGTTVRSYLAGDRISLRLTAGAANNWVAQFAIAEDNANTATNQANIATTKADNATAQADRATAQADRAATAAADADADRIAAQDAAAAAAASYDSFDDRYLGSKSADPTLDNDGNALIEGALYWNTTVKEMRTWDGTAWVTTSVANAVSRGGDTMTGPLEVPAGASGAQVPQAQEVVPRAGGVALTGPLEVPAGASGAQVPQAQEVYLSTAVEISTASGSSVDITGIPTNWNEIHLHFKGVAHTGPLEILVGDSTGYAGWVYDTVNSAVTSAGTLGVGQKTNAIGVRSIAGGAYLSGVIVFYRISLAEWGFSGTLSGTGDDTRTIWVGGRTRDSDNTDQLNSFRLVPAGAFTGGSVLIRGRK